MFAGEFFSPSPAASLVSPFLGLEEGFAKMIGLVETQPGPLSRGSTTWATSYWWVGVGRQDGRPWLEGGKRRSGCVHLGIFYLAFNPNPNHSFASVTCFPVPPATKLAHRFYLCDFLNKLLLVFESWH